MTEAFVHTHAAHCESGVMASLLRHRGAPLSEAMVFGLSRALAFAYLPMIKIGGKPLIGYRMPPKAIIKGLAKSIGLRMTMQTFASPGEGMQALDSLLTAGKVVGVQASVFWLPYFPPDMRFHFNAHNLIVYGREGGQYLISDPVFETPVRCDRASLEKARFVKGMMAPRGLLYYPEVVPARIDYDKAVPASVRKTARLMCKTPLPFIGIKGIRLLSSSIRRLAGRDPEYAKLFLGHIVRMQEEIGTGGAGFRYIYAAFLEEAAGHLDSPLLQEASRKMTVAGDEWRQFAVMVVKAIRPSKGQTADFCGLAEKLLAIGRSEAEIHTALLRGSI